MKLKDRRQRRPKQQELEVAKDFGGKRQPASGALPNAKGDVITDRELVDCKTTTRSLTLSNQDMRRHIHLATKKGLIPIFEVEITNLPSGFDRWVVLPKHEYESLTGRD